MAQRPASTWRDAFLDGFAAELMTPENRPGGPAGWPAGDDGAVLPPPSADGVPPWFTRGAPELLARLARDGGFTVDPRTGEAPRAGFAVNVGVGALVVPAATLFGPDGTEVLRAFLGDHPDLLDPRSTTQLGAWYLRESERVVLSRVDLVDDRARAIAAGVARNQTDVYDLAGDRLVATGVVRR